MSLRIRIWPTLILVLFTMSACQPPKSQGSSPDPSPARSSPQGGAAPTHDLLQDEEAGGHTLKKHVGRSDDQLRERLQRERNISAASTYTDRATAEMAVGTALQQNQSKIDRWLNRDGGHPNLVVDYDGDSAHPIGRSMRRGDDQSQPCSHAVVVLKWDGDRNYHVLTTYPECR